MNASRPRVLVGFADAFAAIETVWSLQRAGMDVLAFARPGSRTPLEHMKGVEMVTVEAPESNLFRSISQLSEAITTLAPDAFLPLDDSSLWLSAHIEPGGTVVAGPDPAGAAFALDKAAQLAAVIDAGLAVPPTQAFEDIGSVYVDRWPVILKPADAVRRVGDRLVRPRGRICADRDELAAARATMTVGTVLRQGLVSGVGEGIFGLFDAEGPSELTAHRRVRMLNPHGSASSACESIAVDEDLAERVVSLLQKKNWRGLFMAEFLRDTHGRAWFMELNGRAWGSLSLARLRGYEYPAWAVQSALGLPHWPSPPEQPPHIVARHLGREIGHLGFVIRGPQTRADVTWPSVGRTVYELLRIRRGHRLYNWKPSQPGVLVRDTWHTVADLARARRRGRS
jgi:hypothetical protein